MTLLDIAMIIVMWTMGFTFISVFVLNITKPMGGWEFLGVIMSLPAGVLFLVIGMAALVRIMATVACGL